MMAKDMVPVVDFTSLKEAMVAESANIKGKVKTVSPMKKGQSCTYFDALLEDEEEDMRIVGFSGTL